MATVTKAQMVENLFSQNLFSKSESAQIINTLFEIIKTRIEDGEDVLITGFGKFSVRNKNQRNGINPQTGMTMILLPRKVVTFKCSGVLREKLHKAAEQPTWVKKSDSSRRTRNRVR